MLSVERLGQSTWQETWMKRRLSRDTQAPAPQQRSRYTVMKPALVQNANCVVSLARDTVTGQTVVLKTLNRSIETDLLIHSEINIHKHVSRSAHPNIVSFVDAIWTKTNVTIVQEYLGGGDLVDLVMECGPLDERTALDFAAQLLSGLAHMHSSGYVHGDVKGEHCVLTNDKNALKLIDFGFSSPVDQKTANGYTAGTLPYTAPEILERNCKDLTKGDVWAAGIVVYSMVTGDFPWEAASLRDPDFAAYSRGGGASIFETVSPRLVKLVKSMLCPDPAKRPSAIEVLAEIEILKSA